MKQEYSFSRYHILWMIVLCYLLPLISLLVFSFLYPLRSNDWQLLSLGLMLAAFGTLILFWIISRMENAQLLHPIPNHFEVKTPPPNSDHPASIDFEEYDLTKRSLAEAQQMQVRLLSEIDVFTEEMTKLTAFKTEALEWKARLEKELESSKQTAKNQMEKQQSYIRELQRTVVDQSSVIDIKQQHVLQLETKVSALANEMKTLLQFAETRAHSLMAHETQETLSENMPSALLEEVSIDPYTPIGNHIKTSQEASIQLKHCLDIAQKIKGSQRFGSQIYSFLDSPADHFSLDLRRLCDRLRGEGESIILLYSPQDHQLLFASNRIKTLTGWSPEKFSQNFLELLTNTSDWKHGIDSLNMRSEADAELQLKTKSGSILNAKAVLGVIPTGIFRDHIIAVLY